MVDWQKLKDTIAAEGGPDFSNLSPEDLKTAVERMEADDFESVLSNLATQRRKFERRNNVAALGLALAETALRGLRAGLLGPIAAV